MNANNTASYNVETQVICCHVSCKNCTFSVHLSNAKPDSFSERWAITDYSVLTHNRESLGPLSDMKSSQVAANERARQLIIHSHLCRRCFVWPIHGSSECLAHRFKPEATKTDIADTANCSTLASRGGCASSADVKLLLNPKYECTSAQRCSTYL